MHAAPAAAKAAGLLTRLYALRQPLLSRHASDALAALASAPGARLPTPDLAALLGGVLGAEGAWERRQPDTLLSSMRLLEAGLPRYVLLKPLTTRDIDVSGSLLDYLRACAWRPLESHIQSCSA